MATYVFWYNAICGIRILFQTKNKKTWDITREEEMMFDVLLDR